jgi:hypothetical protein
MQQTENCVLCCSGAAAAALFRTDMQAASSVIDARKG